jgi:glycosyltransferase involved in cell wall biosynthesis
MKTEEEGVPKPDLAQGIAAASVAEGGMLLGRVGDADVLVAHVDPSSRNTPAKVFEYLATGRPVLCATHPESLSHRLVAELGAGWAVDPRDGAGVEQAIEDAYRRWTGGDLPTRPEVREEALRRHGRDVLARQLAAVLERAAGPPSMRAL